MVLFFALIYGFGIPSLLILCGAFMNKIGGKKLEYSTLAFLVMGYQKHTRYWEVMNMMRCVCRGEAWVCATIRFRRCGGECQRVERFPISLPVSAVS